MRVQLGSIHRAPHLSLPGLKGLAASIGFLPQSSQYIAPPPVTETITIAGGITQPYLTLESHMQQWTQTNSGVGMTPYNAPVSDPSQWPALAAVEASTYCASFQVSDCGNQAAIAAKYGAILQQAWSYFPASVWQAVAASGGSGGLVSPQTDPSYFANAPSAAVQVLAQNPAPVLPAANYSPDTPQSSGQATFSSPAGSTSTSPTPATTGTSFFTEESLISGIPNWAILSAAALALFLVFGGNR